MMDRRDFIQSVLAAAALMGAAPRNSEAADEFAGDFSWFNKSKKYGRFILVYGEDPFIAAQTIMANAREFLPSGTPFTISTMNYAPNREIPEIHSAIAWKYSPGLWGRVGTQGVFIA